MDRPRKQRSGPTDILVGTGRPLKNPRIGIIGRNNLTPKETGIIWYIGRCIARLGHTTVLVPAEGTANTAKAGVEVEHGSLAQLKHGVIENSNHTLIYPDTKLHLKLELRYPDINTRSDVVIITPDNIDLWYEAVRQIVTEKGLELPT